MIRHRTLPLLMLAGLAASSSAGTLPCAWGYDFEISARTEGYGYQLRRLDRDGVTFINRRRITQYLGLRIFNLLDPGQQPYAPGGGKAPALLTLHALMRLDTDFGNYMQAASFYPELENNQLDLMLGALEGRNLWGRVDFTLGRQFDSELFDFFAYDGLRVRARLPIHLAVESYFGSQVLKAHPFSTAVFETDGVSGDPSQEVWVPVFGLAVESEGLRWIKVRGAYRGAASKAPRAPGQPGAGDEPLWGVDQEAVFLGGELTVPRIPLRPLIGLRYNLLTAALDDLQLAALLPLSQRFEGRLEYLRSRPHYDGDSIFNIFALEPFSELCTRGSLRLSPQLSLNGRLGYRWFWQEEELPSEPDDPHALSLGLGGSWRGSRLRAAVESFYLGGRAGDTYGGDLAGSWTLWRRLTVEGRLSLIHYEDGGGLSAADESLTTFGLQAGGQLELVSGVRLLLSVEDNISRLYASALRMLAVLDLEFAP